MKKAVFMVLLALVWTVSVAGAAELKVGDKAPDFKLKDSTGKEYSLEDPRFKGKVLYIAYVDPDEKDTNNHVEDTLKKERESGRSGQGPLRGIRDRQPEGEQSAQFHHQVVHQEQAGKDRRSHPARLRLHDPQPLGDEERFLRCC